jgi:hypothetical protein
LNTIARAESAPWPNDERFRPRPDRSTFKAHVARAPSPLNGERAGVSSVRNYPFRSNFTAAVTDPRHGFLCRHCQQS